MIKRYLIPSDYTAADSWRLIEWCRSIGAEEFTVDFLSTNPARASDRWEQFHKVVRSHARGPAVRERMSGRTADDLMRATERWALNDASLSALKAAFPDGIFQYEPQQDGWFEDLILYRGGDLLLGVLSHEAFAVLRLSEPESADLTEAGLPSHDSLPRIG